MNKEKIEKITWELKHAYGMELVSATSRNTGAHSSVTRPSSNAKAANTNH